MTGSAQFRSGKGSGDENFPVASWLVKRRHRPVILAFYEFVRTADDIADHANLASSEKLSRLDRLEASLLGKSDEEPEGVRLREFLALRGLPTRHAQDLLDAFRQDAVKHRYSNWDDLIDYCSRSAMPVGRFVLDVHGEAKDTWPASDALCAALQIINHLQDCAADYRRLDRVYIPLDALAASGANVESLAKEKADVRLAACIHELAAKTAVLLKQSDGLAVQVADVRLSLEIAAIQSLARELAGLLQVRDPLRDRVHLTRIEALAMTARGAGRALFQRLMRTGAARHGYQAS